MKFNKKTQRNEKRQDLSSFYNSEKRIQWVFSSLGRKTHVSVCTPIPKRHCYCSILLHFFPVTLFLNDDSLKVTYHRQQQEKNLVSNNRENQCTKRWFTSCRKKWNFLVQMALISDWQSLQLFWFRTDNRRTDAIDSDDSYDPGKKPSVCSTRFQWRSSVRDQLGKIDWLANKRPMFTFSTRTHWVVFRWSFFFSFPLTRQRRYSRPWVVTCMSFLTTSILGFFTLSIQFDAARRWPNRWWCKQHRWRIDIRWRWCEKSMEECLLASDSRKANGRK